MKQKLDEHQEPVTDYDEGMVRRLIERITVYEDHLDFEFKCGFETEVQMLTEPSRRRSSGSVFFTFCIWKSADRCDILA